jgi:hypothetical protein
MDDRGQTAKDVARAVARAGIKVGRRPQTVLLIRKGPKGGIAGPSGTADPDDSDPALSARVGPLRTHGVKSCTEVLVEERRGKLGVQVDDERIWSDQVTKWRYLDLSPCFDPQKRRAISQAMHRTIAPL